VCTFDFPKFSFLFPNGKMVWKRIRNLDLEKEMEQFGKKIPNHRMLFWYTLRDERFISIRVRENFETKFTDIMFFDQTAPQSAVAKSHIEDSVLSPSLLRYDLTKEILQRIKSRSDAAWVICSNVLHYVSGGPDRDAK
jgi:hypothetical protein